MLVRLEDMTTQTKSRSKRWQHTLETERSRLEHLKVLNSPASVFFFFPSILPNWLKPSHKLTLLLFNASPLYSFSSLTVIIYNHSSGFHLSILTSLHSLFCASLVSFCSSSSPSFSQKSPSVSHAAEIRLNMEDKMVNIQSETFVVNICGNIWAKIKKMIECLSVMCPVTSQLTNFGHKIPQTKNI